MKIEEKLDLLRTIQKVEAPPYLFTRIVAKIKNEPEVEVSTGKIAAIGLALFILLLVNIAIISNNVSRKNSQTGIAQSYGLSSTNSFYHD